MRTLIFSLLITLSFALQAQNETLLAQIDSAKTYAEMPVIHVSVFRDAGQIKYHLASDKVEEINQPVLAGESFTFYEPAYIHCTADRANIYRYLSTSKSITDNTILIDRTKIMLHLKTQDQKLLSKWMDKYMELFKKQLKR